MFEKRRIAWVDIAKGIAILITIFSHTVENGYIRGFIFTFHMPLFFILSMYTYKFPNTICELKAKSKKAFNHLIFPAVVVHALGIMYQVFIENNQLLFNKDYYIMQLYKFIWASGCDIYYHEMKIDALGITWFLYALFEARLIADFVHLAFPEKKSFVLVEMILTVLGVALSGSIWLPFSLDIALAVQAFFVFGIYMKEMNFEEFSVKIALCSCVSWIILVMITYPDKDIWTYLEIAARRYGLFPISYICAILGTIFICEISVLLEKLPLHGIKILKIIGKNSLYLMCVHALDWIWRAWWNNGGLLMKSLKRIASNLIVFFIIIIISKIHSSIKERHSFPK